MAEQIRATHFTIDSVEPKGTDALRIKGKLTKSGVFEYRRGDETVRELRSDAEVFDAASIDTLRGAHVTLDHPASFVDGDNWKMHSVGTVLQAEADPPYVVGELVVHDSRARHLINAGTLKEISCGYFMTPTPLDGSDADVAQTKIRYNHAALGPQGWGRLGRDVGLTLDSRGNQQLVPVLEEVRTDAEWRADVANAEQHLRAVQAQVAEEEREERKWADALRRGASGFEAGRHAVVTARAKRSHRVADARHALKRAKMHPDARRRLDEMFAPVEIALGLRRDPDALPPQPLCDFDPFCADSDDRLRSYILGE